MQSIYYGTAETAASILPRASWAYDNQAKITDYNPELSKQMLKEMGLENLKLDLWYQSPPNHITQAHLRWQSLSKLI